MFAEPKFLVDAPPPNIISTSVRHFQGSYASSVLYCIGVYPFFKFENI